MTVHRIGTLDDLPERKLEARTIEGVPILLIRVGDRVRAFDNRCPHQGTLLSEGRLEGETLICRSHQWRFDVGSIALAADSKSAFSAKLKEFRVREENGVLLVEFD